MLSMIKKLGKIFKTHIISFYQCRLLEAGVLLVLALGDGEALLGGVEDVHDLLAGLRAVTPHLLHHDLE